MRTSQLLLLLVILPKRLHERVAERIILSTRRIHDRQSQLSHPFVNISWNLVHFYWELWVSHHFNFHVASRKTKRRLASCKSVPLGTGIPARIPRSSGVSATKTGKSCLSSRVPTTSTCLPENSSVQSCNPSIQTSKSSPRSAALVMRSWRFSPAQPSNPPSKTIITADTLK